MFPKISLCIPTYNRFDTFLEKNLKLYLENPYIHEIVITDEDGKDMEKILERFSSSKLFVYKNDTVLGAFLNKSRAISLATQDWICLMDSDNYAPPSYFEAWKKYIEQQGLDSKKVYMPIQTFQTGKIGFDYSKFKDMKLNHTTINQYNLDKMNILLNTGNYMFHKANYLESNQFFPELHASCQSVEVVLRSVLLLLNRSTFVVVPEMTYEHIVHKGSYYLQHSRQFKHHYRTVSEIYQNLAKYLPSEPKQSLNPFEMTLEEWQNRPKSEHEILYNCSEYTHLNDEWVSFPIGMGWSIIRHKEYIERFHQGAHQQSVLCAINPKTDKRRRPGPPNRTSILNVLQQHHIHNTTISPRAYFEKLSDYKFVISPEGNGIDCHRHYEALMAGCIPIIEDRPNIREKYRRCPILFTTDYSEITESYLSEQYKKMSKNTYDFSRLILQTYSEEDQRQIKDNGNYWAQRLSRQKWYV
jgi:glycosyltransferase involved in cell wall biosynthesis